MKTEIAPAPSRSHRASRVSVRDLWVIAGIASATVLAWIVLAKALSVFVLLFASILIGEGMRPAVERVHRHAPRAAAVAIVFGSAFALGAIVIALLIEPIATELAVLIQNIPQELQALQDRLIPLQRYVSDNPNARQVLASVWGASGGWISEMTQRLVGGPVVFARFVSNAILMLAMAALWILASDRLQKFVVGCCPPGSQPQIVSVFHEIAGKLSAYVRAVALNALVVAVATGVGLALVGGPYALVLGLVAGVCQVIPFIGPILSGLIVLCATLAASGWLKTTEVMGIFLLVQIVDGNLVSPLIFSKGIHLDLLTIVFATLLGGALLGAPGVFLAVPAAAAVQVIVVRLVAPVIRRALNPQPVDS